MKEIADILNQSGILISSEVYREGVFLGADEIRCRARTVETIEKINSLIESLGFDQVENYFDDGKMIVDDNVVTDPYYVVAWKRA